MTLEEAKKVVAEAKAKLKLEQCKRVCKVLGVVDPCAAERLAVANQCTIV